MHKLNGESGGGVLPAGVPIPCHRVSRPVCRGGNDHWVEELSRAVA